MSAKFARDAFKLLVFDLYHSQVGSVTCAYPNAVDGRFHGIKFNNFFLLGFANCLKEDS